MRYDMSRRGFLAGAALCTVGAATTLAGCGSSAPVSARPALSFCEGAAPSVYAAGVYLAKNQGYFEENGLDVSIVQAEGGTSAEVVVNAGQAQFGLSSQRRLAGCFAIDEPASIIAVATVLQPDDAKREAYPSVVIANDAYLVAHPDESHAFMDALSRGYFYVANNPQTSADIMLEMRPQLDENAVHASFERFASRLFDAEGEWGIIDWGRWDGCFTRLHEEGVIDRAIPQHHGFTNDYLEDAKK